MVESSQTSYKLLFAVIPSCGVEGLIARMRTPLPANVSHDIVRSTEQYEALADKYSYDALVVLYGGPFVQNILNDQANNSKKCKWVHSMSAGLDAYCAAADFVKADHIPITNVKGAFSHVLGEFIALGILYHTKKVENFMARKAQAKWEIEPVELASNKTMAVVGFGDIGAACGKVAKNGFGTRVIGLKRRPEVTSDEHRACADEVVGLDQLDRVLAEADFVVGVLPKTAETGDFFNMERCFSKMKKSAVFMNIGRGPTVHEEDLVKALQDKTIAGAVLDVYKVEPLVKESPLWSLPNVLMTPHCADQDPEYLDRAMDILSYNLDAFMSGKPLKNVCDKQAGY
jgi:phosphoglycerate dehydrogenase-like enzyme